MVSFVCDSCQTTLKKNKVPTHFGCRNTTFSCVDCCGTFTLESHRAHTECISEAEKHQGKLYKGKRAADGDASAPKPKRAPRAPVKDKYDDSSSDSDDDDMAALTAPRGGAKADSSSSSSGKSEKKDKKEKKEKKSKKAEIDSEDEPSPKAAAPVVVAVAKPSVVIGSVISAPVLSAAIVKLVSKKGSLSLQKLAKKLDGTPALRDVCAALESIAGKVVLSIAEDDAE
jgi:cell growth-regulating nucleolar protein